MGDQHQLQRRVETPAPPTPTVVDARPEQVESARPLSGLSTPADAARERAGSTTGSGEALGALRRKTAGCGCGRHR